MKDTEREIKQKIRRYLNTIENGKFVSYCAYPYGEAGTPDYVGCIDGRAVLIEVKQEGKGLNPNQVVRIDEWTKVGATVLIAHSVKECKEVLDAYRN